MKNSAAMIVDSHLLKANGDVDQQQSNFEERLSGARKTAADEWSGRIVTFLPRAEDLSGAPDGSWLVDFTFKLKKPFTSKSETEFDGSHNLIVRDHLTGLPTVKPTTWKGHLAFAADREDIEPAARKRLFGTILGGESGQAGRLRFFPTFFVNGTNGEIITPLHRDTRTPARGPIDIEVIPAGQCGRFCLLYIPWPRGDSWHRNQIADDLLAASRAVKAMLLDYGFSAKKTSGWGVVTDSLASGTLTVNGTDWPQATAFVKGATSFEEPDEAFLKFMDSFGQPLSQLKKASDEWLSNKEFRRSGLNVGSARVYRKFLSWYKGHGAEWARRLTGRTLAATIPLQSYGFEKVTEFVCLADRLASSLKESGGG